MSSCRVFRKLGRQSRRRRRGALCQMLCEVCGRPLKGTPYFNALYSRLCRACFEADAAGVEEERAV